MEKYKELGRVTSRDMGAQFKEVIESLKKMYMYIKKKSGRNRTAECLFNVLLYA